MTLISNNCSGGYLYMDMGIQYTSPTMWTQILYDEYPKFCKNLKHYMECEVTEYKDFSEVHRKQIINNIGMMPDFPCGLIDDVVILFRHYSTFEQAKEKWNKRKQRIDYEHLIYMFVVETDKYINESIEFGNLNLKNSVLFTRDFEVAVPIEHHTYSVPSNSEYLAVNRITGRRNFEGNLNMIEYIKGIE